MVAETLNDITLKLTLRDNKTLGLFSNNKQGIKISFHLCWNTGTMKNTKLPNLQKAFTEMEKHPLNFQNDNQVQYEQCSAQALDSFGKTKQDFQKTHKYFSFIVQFPTYSSQSNLTTTNPYFSGGLTPRICLRAVRDYISLHESHTTP